MEEIGKEERRDGRKRRDGEWKVGKKRMGERRRAG